MTMLTAGAAQALRPAAAGRSTPAGVPRWHLLPLRVYLGYWFLKSGLAMQGAFLMENQLRGVFAQWAPGNPHPVARAFLDGRGQLWSELIAYGVAGGATAIGVALIAGLFTRGAALAGALLVTTTLMLGGHASASLLAHGQLVLVALVTLALCGAGRCLGFDLWLHRRASVMPFTLLY